MELHGYDANEKLGKGGFGIVWKAFDKQRKRFVAVKHITGAFRDEMNAQRTYREVMYLRQFRGHPNVVKLLNVHSASNNLDIYLVFELMETDLHQAIYREEGRYLNDDQKRFIMNQLFKTVKFLHSGNVIHRDLKPENILLDVNFCCKVADFGLARSLPAEPKLENRITKLTNYLGTPGYRAPEVIVGSTRYTHGIDMWSLGCVLIEMYLLYAPFNSTTDDGELDLILSVLPRPSSEDIKALHGTWRSAEICYKHQYPSGSLAKLMTRQSADVLDLLQQLLVFNPSKRISAVDALAHAYVSRFNCLEEEPSMSKYIIPKLRDEVQLTVEDYREELYHLAPIESLKRGEGSTHSQLRGGQVLPTEASKCVADLDEHITHYIDKTRENLKQPLVRKNVSEQPEVHVTEKDQVNFSGILLMREGSCKPSTGSGVELFNSYSCEGERKLLSSDLWKSFPAYRREQNFIKTQEKVFPQSTTGEISMEMIRQNFCQVKSEENSLGKPTQGFPEHGREENFTDMPRQGFPESTTEENNMKRILQNYPQFISEENFMEHPGQIFPEKKSEESEMQKLIKNFFPLRSEENFMEKPEQIFPEKKSEESEMQKLIKNFFPLRSEENFMEKPEQIFPEKKSEESEMQKLIKNFFPLRSEENFMEKPEQGFHEKRTEESFRQNFPHAQEIEDSWYYPQQGASNDSLSATAPPYVRFSGWVTENSREESRNNSTRESRKYTSQPLRKSPSEQRKYIFSKQTTETLHNAQENYTEHLQRIQPRESCPVQPRRNISEEERNGNCTEFRRKSVTHQSKRDSSRQPEDFPKEQNIKFSQQFMSPPEQCTSTHAMQCRKAFNKEIKVNQKILTDEEKRQKHREWTKHVSLYLKKHLNKAEEKNLKLEESRKKFIEKNKEEISKSSRKGCFGRDQKFVETSRQGFPEYGREEDSRGKLRQCSSEQSDVFCLQYSLTEFVPKSTSSAKSNFIPSTSGDPKVGSGLQQSQMKPKGSGRGQSLHKYGREEASGGKLRQSSSEGSDEFCHQYSLTEFVPKSTSSAKSNFIPSTSGDPKVGSGLQQSQMEPKGRGRGQSLHKRPFM